jgi:hypothetical protein
LTCLCVAGCSDKLEATVSGRVSFGGQPLTTGAVTFHPVGDGPPGIGQIQSDGTYQVSVGTETGLTVGEHIVTVVATGPAPEPTPANPEPLPTSLIPARYGNRETTPLRHTITPGANSIDLALEPE